MQNMMPQMNDEESRSILKTTDRLLPIANISKIMKKTIPPKGKISKDSKDVMQKSASEFIAIVTCRAKDICELEARKTVTGEDLIRAMSDLDMPYYAEITRAFFDQYKKVIGEGKGKRYDGEL